MARRTTAFLIVGVLIMTLYASMVVAQGKFSLPGIPNPGVADYPPEVGKYGGTYVVSSISDPRTFNAIVVQDTASGAVTGVMFDGLVEQNYITGEIGPSLAESWTVSSNGRTWVFTLREGLVWSDGTPLTADDVVFSMQAIFTPGVDNSIRSLLTFSGQQVTWRKLDRRRIQFTTPTSLCPVGLFLRFIAALPVMPKHKLADALAKSGAEFSRTWGVDVDPKTMVGSGPFLLQSFVPGQRVVMLKNQKYWKVDKKGQRLPYLVRYIILTVPNQDAARLKFLSKEIDAYGARGRDYAEFKGLEKQGNFTIYDGPETFTREFIVFNQNPAGIKAPKLTWFSDVKFRIALAHAIDQDTMSRQVLAGRGTTSTSDISAGNKLYYDASLKPYPYDLTRAQQLLAEAGYRKGPDGFLRDSAGNIVEFTIATNAGNQDREAYGNIVRQDFVKLGIRATFVTESFPSLVGKLTGTYNWEAIIIGFTGGIEHGTARNLWLTTGDLHMWNPNQKAPATAWEGEIDKIMEAYSCEPDQAKRKALMTQFQRVVFQNLPMLYFPYQKTQPAVRNTIGNIKLGLQGVTGTLDTRYYKGPYRP